MVAAALMHPGALWVFVPSVMQAQDRIDEVKKKAEVDRGTGEGWWRNRLGWIFGFFGAS